MYCVFYVMLGPLKFLPLVFNKTAVKGRKEGKNMQDNKMQDKAVCL